MSSMAEAMQETEPWLILSFCTSFLRDLVAADSVVCGHGILRIGMPRVHDPSYRRSSRSHSLLASKGELQFALSSV